MERRAFMSTLAGGLLAAPLAAEEQTKRSRPRIARGWWASAWISSWSRDQGRSCWQHKRQR
jgi:hypothetical protein